MDNICKLIIFTSNEMEGNGFKSFFGIHRPEYKVTFILPLPFANYEAFIKNAKNSIIVLDSDCIEKNKLVDFLLDITKQDIKCIIYSRLTTPGLLIKVRQLGISGYVSKTSPLNCLLDCLKVIELGGIYYDSCFSVQLKEISDFELSLSKMQQNLLYEALLFPNRSIREIADSLKISKHTAEVHLSNLYQKIGVDSFSELVDKFSI